MFIAFFVLYPMRKYKKPMVIKVTMGALFSVIDYRLL